MAAVGPQNSFSRYPSGVSSRLGGDPADGRASLAQSVQITEVELPVGTLAPPPQAGQASAPNNPQDAVTPRQTDDPRVYQKIRRKLNEDPFQEFENAQETRKLRRFLISWTLELIIWVIIGLNAIATIVETSQLRQRLTPSALSSLLWIQDSCLILYVTEITIKCVVLRRQYIQDVYNRLDVIVVVTASLSYVLAGSVSGFRSPGASACRKISSLRILRLAAAVRVISVFPFFFELWLLVRGLLYSLRTLMWGVSISFLIIFLFAIFATTVIGQDGAYSDSETGYDGINSPHARFGSLVYSIQSLFQIMTLEGWPDVVQPVLDVNPYMWFFFCAYIWFVVYALGNLLTAVLVESAVMLARENEELVALEKRRELKKLRKYLISQYGHLLYRRPPRSGLSLSPARRAGSLTRPRSPPRGNPNPSPSPSPNINVESPTDTQGDGTSGPPPSATPNASAPANPGGPQGGGGGGGIMDIFSPVSSAGRWAVRGVGGLFQRQRTGEAGGAASGATGGGGGGGAGGGSWSGFPASVAAAVGVGIGATGAEAPPAARTKPPRFVVVESQLRQIRKWDIMQRIMEVYKIRSSDLDWLFYMLAQEVRISDLIPPDARPPRSQSAPEVIPSGGQNDAAQGSPPMQTQPTQQLPTVHEHDHHGGGNQGTPRNSTRATGLRASASAGPGSGGLMSMQSLYNPQNQLIQMQALETGIEDSRLSMRRRSSVGPATLGPAGMAAAERTLCVDLDELIHRMQEMKGGAKSRDMQEVLARQMNLQREMDALRILIIRQQQMMALHWQHSMRPQSQNIQGDRNHTGAVLSSLYAHEGEQSTSILTFSPQDGGPRSQDSPPQGPTLAQQQTTQTWRSRPPPYPMRQERRTAAPNENEQPSQGQGNGGGNSGLPNAPSAPALLGLDTGVGGGTTDFEGLETFSNYSAGRGVVMLPAAATASAAFGASRRPQQLLPPTSASALIGDGSNVMAETDILDGDRQDAETATVTAQNMQATDSSRGGQSPVHQVDISSLHGRHLSSSILQSVGESSGVNSVREGRRSLDLGLGRSEASPPSQAAPGAVAQNRQVEEQLPLLHQQHQFLGSSLQDSNFEFSSSLELSVGEQLSRMDSFGHRWLLEESDTEA
uniref:Ion transport domain-containing protein n=1 Tax=Chromera velia CCMP2878 TaxID=1169474 RepID=A0A0G4F3X7_9ALVE|eukprot:Cvel_14952.t1-p1 / transcript=Cvel_14952.t1 / gene=Cvel_14952 / organism=Chromera_velia_CCMP2878 / gene_product=Sodium channel protein type 2 subunit alpha, putative / transcript_product=Sodium channel protein type 2 subunit alpha, putative / location=Cvel_scaffold1085:24619-30090(-) / protein_length=1124 / sequence_SO=supercontig / SO=protein_coding / is_pseudo=false